MQNNEDGKQKQIRQKISEIYSDQTIPLGDKQRMIMEVMRGNLNVYPLVVDNGLIDPITIVKINAEIIKESIEINQQKEEKVIESDCIHYQRGCLIQCPTEKCKTFTKCRLCHDSIISDHKLDRFSIETVMCMNCNCVQRTSQKCTNCDFIFGKYYCDNCHLFENNSEKDIYHCKDCGICRIGKTENYIHCLVCSHCIHVDSYQSHKCFTNTWNDCPICMDGLKDSTRPLILLPCGHGTHHDCVNELLQNDYRCPLCKKSIGDMSHVWNKIRTDMDNLRGNSNVQIDFVTSGGDIIKKTCICNDCGEQYESQKNMFNMYSCPKCLSFNSS